MWGVCIVLHVAYGLGARGKGSLALEAETKADEAVCILHVVVMIPK